MKKAELRKEYKAKRQALLPAQVNDFSMVFAQRAISEWIQPGQTIHCYLPIARFNEANTFYLIKMLLEQGYTVYSSVTHMENNTLSHFSLHANIRLQNDEWGIPFPVDTPLFETVDPDVIIVPLLCCDQYGNRVGYGKGYYDRFLSSCPKALKIGFSFFDPVDSIEDAAQHDVPINVLITPYQTHVFK